jgi:hypothetical protein
LEISFKKEENLLDISGYSKREENVNAISKMTKSTK